MDPIDEWQLEMNRMLDIFKHESESSLRKISQRFEALDQPFNDEFRQYFLKMSTQRLDMSFTKIEIERWVEVQAKNNRIELDLEQDLQNGHDYVSTCNTSTSSNDAIMDAQLTEDDYIYLNVEREEVVEAIDSVDEGDDIQYDTERQNENIFVGDYNEEFKFKSVEDQLSIPLVSCESNQGKVAHLMEIDQGNHEYSTDMLDVKGEFKLKIEFMDEKENIPVVTFDPNLENDRSSRGSGSIMQQSSSSLITVNQSKRIGGNFKCKHCDISFNSKTTLKKHQPVHANGKLIGVKADLNGMYRCTLCIRRFTNVCNLSKHMKVHNNNQYLYDCVRCMRQFDLVRDRNRHESQCEGRYYECHLCKVYVAKLKIHMQYHMRTHSGAKPFLCLACNKFFQTKSGLRQHMNIIHSRIDS